jgi:hypothetical protein
MLRWESAPSPVVSALKANIWPRATHACPVLFRAPPHACKGEHSVQNSDLNIHSLYAGSSFCLNRGIFIPWALLLYFYLVCVGMSVCICIKVLGNWVFLFVFFFFFYHMSPGNWTENIKLGGMCSSLLSHLASPTIYFSSVSCSPS